MIAAQLFAAPSQTPSSNQSSFVRGKVDDPVRRTDGPPRVSLPSPPLLHLFGAGIEAKIREGDERFFSASKHVDQQAGKLGVEIRCFHR